MEPFGIDHSGDSEPVPVPEAVPTFEIWHVGESRFNGRDGQPLLVACMRNTRTGKETPVLYSRAYGLDSLCHAHAARLMGRPEGWEPGAGSETLISVPGLGSMGLGNRMRSEG
jgi:hypothetical protein